jgi:peptidoglycan biosynthesis protein MviN/MurJ (putative lipid II flippase)
LAKTVAAAAAMGGVSWTTLHLLQPAFDAGRAPVRLGVTILVFGVSAATYLALARLFRLAEAHQVMTTALGFLPGDHGEV